MRDSLSQLIFNKLSETCRECSSLECTEELTDYLLANGVIVPPCKVGDTVYYLASNLHTKITKIRSGTVSRIAITEGGIDIFADNWAAKLPYGKRSFITREDAEQALKGGAE